MAPIAMVLGEVMSPEVGIIAVVVFLVLSITGLALCGQCQRKSGNAYDVNATAPGTSGKDVQANGTSDTKITDPSDVTYTTWRNHKNMPESTLERQKAYTQ